MTDPKAPTEPQAPPPDSGSTAITPHVANADDPKFDEAVEGDLGGVGELPADAKNRIAVQRAMFRERLAMEKNERAFVAAATKVTWAKNMSPDALLKLAGYAKEKDLDLLLEFHILGGSSGYVNAKWYIRQLGNLVADGVVEYAYYDVVNKDARLDKLASSNDPAEKEYATTETSRRMRERVKYGLPEDAIAAVVWHVKLDRMAQEVTAAQAVGGYRGKTAEGKQKDPIGEEFPRETAITRGCRKVMLALAHVAPRLKAKVEAADAAAKEIAAMAPSLAEESRRELRRLYGVPHVRNVSPDEYAGEVRQTPATVTDNRSD